MKDSEFSKYVSGLSSHNIMTAEEEAEVAKSAYSGNPNSQQDLVLANLRYVVSIVTKHYSASKLDKLELIQEGNLGLMQAAQTFDPENGVRFLSYARHRIMGAIKDYVNSTIDENDPLNNAEQYIDNIDDFQDSNTSIYDGETRVMPKYNKLYPDNEWNTNALQLLIRREDSNEAKTAAHFLRESIENVRPYLNSKEVAILDSRMLASTPITLKILADKFEVQISNIQRTEDKIKNKIRQQMKLQQGGN